MLTKAPIYDIIIAEVMKMPRQARKKSESGIYHIMLRGINKQEIFREKEDYQRFIDGLKKYKPVSGYRIYGYCLMSNHVHILLKIGQEDVGIILKRIAGSYVYWYNRKYDRVGPLFQDRFKSEPVDSDEYFLTVLRYIHQNPVKAGLCKNLGDYEYSSYNEYINRRDDPVDIDFAYSILGTEDFTVFNNAINDDKCLDYDEKRRFTDKEAEVILERLLNGRTIEEIINCEEKEKLIRDMKEEGLSIRQISRLTGLSVGIVRKY